MIRCEWLGTPRILDNGKSIHFQRRKALGILAYLSVRTLPASREELKTLFWPEADMKSAGRSLRTALSEIRSKLKDVLRDAGNDAVEVNRDSMETDIAVFRAAVEAFGKTGELNESTVHTCERAVKLWRGPFLQGLELRGSYRLDDWLLLTTESINREITGLLEPLAEWYLRIGDTAGSRTITGTWLEVDPLDEAAHRMIIKADMAASGRTEALRRYEVLRKRLQNELGVPPSPETELLVKEIREDNAAGIPNVGISFKRTYTIAGCTRALPGAAGDLRPGQVLSQSLRDEFSRRGQVRYLEIDTAEGSGLPQHDTVSMGRKLGTPHMLAGRCTETARDSLSVDINLSDILDGRILMDRNTPVTVQDIPALTGDIAEEVIRRLTDNNPMTHPVPAESPQCRAWRMQGIHQRRTGIGRNLTESIHCMDEAVKADPKSLRAVADKALSYAYAGSWGHWAMNPDEAYGSARKLALAVLEENPNEARALLTLGTIEAEYDNLPETGLRHIRLAMEQEPWDPEILVEAAQTQQRLWLREEGLETAREAYERDPADYGIIITLANGLVETERYRESLEIMDRFEALYPNDPNGLATRSIILSLMGRHSEALENAELLLSVGHQETGMPLFSDHIGYMAARAGQTSEAEAQLARLEKACDRNEAAAVNVALVLLGLGRTEECIQLLEKGVEGSPSEIMSITFNPLWDQLVFEPGFRDVCRKIGISGLPAPPAH